MKGQISVEAVLAMALMLTLYAVIVAWAFDLSLRYENTGGDAEKVSILMEAAYAKGKGTEVDLEVYEGFDTAPGLLILSAQDGDSLPHALDPAVLRNNMTVHPDTYTLEVTDDGVSFH